MAEELWSTVTLRNMIMEIAETIAPIYKSRLHYDSSVFPRFVSVKNVEFVVQNIGETIQFDTDIEFLSDTGSWIENVLIRKFVSQQQFEEERSGYARLEARLLPYENINPTDILHIDKEELIIIYEGANGKRVDECYQDKKLVDFQLGVLAAHLHTSERYEIDIEQMVNLSAYLLKYLPFTETDKKNLEKLLKLHFRDLKDCVAGYLPATIYDPRLFYFTPISKDSITKSHILMNTCFKIDVIFHPPQDTIYDRMGDLASYYAEIAFNEYSYNGEVHETVEHIIHFLEGYEAVFETTEVSFIDLLYPSGLTLDLHIMLSVWLMYYYQITDEVDISSLYDLDDVVKFSYFVLQQTPFRLYHNEREIYSEI